MIMIQGRWIVVWHALIIGRLRAGSTETKALARAPISRQHLSSSEIAVDFAFHRIGVCRKHSDKSDRVSFYISCPRRDGVGNFFVQPVSNSSVAIGASFPRQFESRNYSVRMGSEPRKEPGESFWMATGPIACGVAAYFVHGVEGQFGLRRSY
jgi:hypothetical protein